MVIDPETGEAGAPGSNHKFDKVAAVVERIGNVDMLGHLREKVTAALGGNASATMRILSSDSGVVFSGVDIELLRAEVGALETHDDESVVAFSSQLRALLRAASAHGNPIVTT